VKKNEELLGCGCASANVTREIERLRVANPRVVAAKIKKL